MKLTYDKRTAEFRTIRNLRGYKDPETGFPKSMVDDSDYEDINVLVARMLRGEVVHCGRPVQYDGTGTAEELIAQASPLEQSGSDLADIGPIIDSLQAPKGVPTPPAPQVTPAQSEGGKPPSIPVPPAPAP